MSSTRSMVYRIDPATVSDLDYIRQRLMMTSNEDVVLRAIALMKVAVEHEANGVVTILTADGRTLPVRLG